MSALRACRRLAIWMAGLAVLMAALAPPLSQAFGAAAGASWVEVCTAQGSRWVTPDEAGTPDPAAPAGHAGLLDHCPWCGLQAHSPGITPSPVVWLPVSALAHALPPAFLQAPRTLHTWRSAQPRGPPTLS